MTELKQEKKSLLPQKPPQRGKTPRREESQLLAASFDRGDDIFRLWSLEPKEAAAAYRERCVQNRP